jgi:hypothetical protein
MYPASVRRQIVARLRSGEPVAAVRSIPGFVGSSILTGQSACGLGCGPLFAGAVESYPAARVVLVAESAADAFDLFDEPVVALGTRVGDAGRDEGVDFGPPGVDGAG